MEIEGTELTLNGVTYVKKGSEQSMAVDTDGLQYCIVRGDRSGVFAGYLESRNGREVTLKSCRRLWCWYGAASCSQLAIDGVSRPNDCKFPAAIKQILILDAIEVIPATEKSKKSIESVNVWKA